MSNLAIVGTSDYETLVEQSNLKIQKFISKHPECIKYEPNVENGFVFITLNFGKVHSEELKAISEMCMNSLIDAVFTIGDLPVSVVYSNDNLIKFKGKQTEVEEKIISTTVLPDVAKSVLTEKSKADVVIPTDFISKIHNFLKTYEDGRNSDSEFRSLTEKIGITYKPYAGKGHISLDLQKLADVDTSAIAPAKPIDPKAFVNTVKYVCRIFNMLIKEKPALVTGDLIKILDKNEIVLESISKSVVQFAYGDIPEEPVTTLPSTGSEVEYKKTPGSITRVRLVTVESPNGFESKYYTNNVVDSVLYTLETPITRDSSASDIYVAIESIIKQSFTDTKKYLSNWSGNKGEQISSTGYEASNGMSVVKYYAYIFNDDTDIKENPTDYDYVGLTALNHSSFNVYEDPIITGLIESGTAMKVVIPYPTGTSAYGYSGDIEYVATQAHLN